MNVSRQWSVVSRQSWHVIGGEAGIPWFFPLEIGTLMKKPMKLALTFSALAVLLTACRRHAMGDDASAELRRKVVGTWSRYKYSESNNYSVTIVMSPGGGYTTTFTDLRSNGTKFVLEGTWQLANTNMTLTVTNASGDKHVPIGTVEHAKILRLDEHEIVVEQFDDSSETIFLKRIR